MKKKSRFEDDGRVIADMSFEGTKIERAGRKKEISAKTSEEPLDRKQTMSAVWGALLAGLLIGLVFVGVFLLFLLFATKIWFR